MLMPGQCCRCCYCARHHPSHSYDHCFCPATLDICNAAAALGDLQSRPGAQAMFLFAWSITMPSCTAHQRCTLTPAVALQQALALG
mmetsp:Transcript_20517/g.44886  ORF Transcript_20517/g.44886 Transcript_20517/m.44886 type:complete len:86 (+) Transcript_20517:431-688(+)